MSDSSTISSFFSFLHAANTLRDLSAARPVATNKKIGYVTIIQNRMPPRELMGDIMLEIIMKERYVANKDAANPDFTAC